MGRPFGSFPRMRESRLSLRQGLCMTKSGWIPARAALGRNDGQGEVQSNSLRFVD